MPNIGTQQDWDDACSVDMAVLFGGRGMARASHGGFWMPFEPSSVGIRKGMRLPSRPNKPYKQGRAIRKPIKAAKPEAPSRDLVAEAIAKAQNVAKEMLAKYEVSRKVAKMAIDDADANKQVWLNRMRHDAERVGLNRLQHRVYDALVRIIAGSSESLNEQDVRRSVEAKYHHNELISNALAIEEKYRIAQGKRFIPYTSMIF